MQLYYFIIEKYVAIKYIHNHIYKYIYIYVYIYKCVLWLQLLIGNGNRFVKSYPYITLTPTL